MAQHNNEMRFNAREPARGAVHLFLVWHGCVSRVFYPMVYDDASISMKFEDEWRVSK